MENLERKDEAARENTVQKADSDFITERIKQRPVNKVKLLRRTLFTAAMAVIFASVACLTFLILEPVISNWLYPKEEPAPIEFPAETDEMLPEDMIADDSQMEEPPPPVEFKLEDEQIAKVLDNVSLDMDDYASMYGLMAEVAQEAGKSLVTVTGSVSDVDWFNDTYEKKNQTSGIIVAKTEREILVLVNYEKIIDAENIVVTFPKGEQAQANLRKRDVNTKLAVLSVALDSLGEETPNGVKAADLAASSGSRAIVGNPVIALFDKSHNGEDMKNLVSALGITELRRVIERMSNAREQAYLGTYGMDVTPDANESLGVPFGAYIAEIAMDSPAMTAGIQSGDVITAIGEKAINAYGDLVSALTELKPDETVAITLMRQGPEEYVPMEVDVTLGTLE